MKTSPRMQVVHKTHCFTVEKPPKINNAKNFVTFKIKFNLPLNIWLSDKNKVAH